MSPIPAPTPTADGPNMVEGPGGMQPVSAPVALVSSPPPAAGSPSLVAPVETSAQDDFSGDMQRILKSDMDPWQTQKAIREAAESRRKGSVSRSVVLPGVDQSSVHVELVPPVPFEEPKDPGLALPIRPPFPRHWVTVEARQVDRDYLAAKGAEVDARLAELKAQLDTARNEAVKMPEAEALRNLKKRLAAVRAELAGIQAQTAAAEARYSDAVAIDADHRPIEQELRELDSKKRALKHRQRLLGGGDPDAQDYSNECPPKLQQLMDSYESKVRQLVEAVRVRLLQESAAREQAAVTELYKLVLDKSLVVHAARAEGQYLASLPARTPVIPSIEV